MLRKVFCPWSAVQDRSVGTWLILTEAMTSFQGDTEVYQLKYISCRSKEAGAGCIGSPVTVSKVRVHEFQKGGSEI